MPEPRAFRVRYYGDEPDAIVVTDEIQWPKDNDGVAVFLLRGQGMVLAVNWGAVRSVERLTDAEVAELAAREDAQKLLVDLYVAIVKRRATESASND